jgi:hypothetical protein
MMRPLWCLETSGLDYSATQRCIREGWNNELHHRENLRIRTCKYDFGFVRRHSTNHLLKKYLCPANSVTSFGVLGSVHVSASLLLLVTVSLWAVSINWR